MLHNRIAKRQTTGVNKAFLLFTQKEQKQEKAPPVQSSSQSLIANRQFPNRRMASP